MPAPSGPLACAPGAASAMRRSSGRCARERFSARMCCVPPAPAHSPDRDAALLELTRRYFLTRGPATLKDFAWWSGLTVADASRGVQIAGQSLEREVIGDETYWSDARARSQRKSSVMAHLLPNYDEYFIGFKNRSAIEQRLGATAAMMRDALPPHIVADDVPGA